MTFLSPSVPDSLYNEWAAGDDTPPDECWECGEVLKESDDKAEIVLVSDIERIPNEVHQSYIIHAGCYREVKHRVA